MSKNHDIFMISFNLHHYENFQYRSGGFYYDNKEDVEDILSKLDFVRIGDTDKFEENGSTISERELAEIVKLKRHKANKGRNPRDTIFIIEYKIDTYNNAKRHINRKYTHTFDDAKEILDKDGFSWYKDYFFFDELNHVSAYIIEVEKFDEDKEFVDWEHRNPYHILF